MKEKIENVLAIGFVILYLLTISVSTVIITSMAANASAPNQCATIQSGTLYAP